jgi:uncharacterized membrane protein
MRSQIIKLHSSLCQNTFHFMERFLRWTILATLFLWGLVAVFAGFGPWPLALDNLRNPVFIAIVFGILAALVRKNDNVNWLDSDQAVKVTLLLISALFFKGTLTSFYSFETNAYDFSVFNHLIPMTLDGRFMDSPVSPGNHFAKHLTYIIFLLTPFQLIFKSSVALIILHGAFISVAVWIYERWLNRLKFTNFQKIQALLAFAGFFLLGRFVMSDFRIESFYPICGFYFLYAFFFGPKWSLALAAVLLFSVKEDAAVYMVAFATGIVVSAKFFPKMLPGSLNARSQFLRALAVGIPTFIGFIVNLKVILPMMQESKSAHLLGYMHRYGPSVWDFMWGLITHPVDLISVFLNPVFATLLICFLGLFFLPLWSALPILAYLAVHFLSSIDVMHTLGFYYSAPLLPLIFIGGSFAIKKMTDKNRKYSKAILPLHMLFCLLVGGGYLKFQRTPANYSDFNQIKTEIPEDKEICVQSSIMPHLGTKHGLKLLELNCADNKVPYILVNALLDPFPHTKEQFPKFVEALKTNDNYQVVVKGSFELFFLKTELN